MPDILKEIKNLSPVSEEYKQSSRWSASGLGHCKRIQLLKAHGVRLPETPQRERVLSICNAIHADVQEWFKKKFPYVECELTVNDPALHLGGRLDILIHNNE